MTYLITDSNSLLQSMETQAKGVRAGPEAHRAVTYSTLGDKQQGLLYPAWTPHLTGNSAFKLKIHVKVFPGRC